MSSVTLGTCYMWMVMLLLLWLPGFAVVGFSSGHWPLSSLQKMFHCWRKKTYDACAWSWTLYGSEKGNELALHRAEIRMMDVLCKIKGQTALHWIKAAVRNTRRSKSGIKNYIAMEWTCFKKGWRCLGEKCVTLEVEGSRQRRRTRKTRKEVWSMTRMVCR